MKIRNVIQNKLIKRLNVIVFIKFLKRLNYGKYMHNSSFG